MNPVHLENCPTCGASRKATWYKLQPGHLRALVKFHRAILHYGRNRIHIRKEMYDVTGDCPFRLTLDELTNFSFLRTFALVHHADLNPRSGYWLMTELGARFLKGEKVVHTRKLISNGQIIERDQASLKHIGEFKGKLPDYPKSFEYVILPLTPPTTGSLFPAAVKVVQTNQQSA
jgi:hypothetical protein